MPIRRLFIELAHLWQQEGCIACIVTKHKIILNTRKYIIFVSTTQKSHHLSNNNNNNGHTHHHNSFRRRSESEPHETNATSPHFADDHFVYKSSAANNNDDTVTSIITITSVPRATDTEDSHNLSDSETNNPSSSDATTSTMTASIELNPPTPQINVRKEGIISETGVGEAVGGGGHQGPGGRGLRGSLDLDVPHFGKSAAVEELIRRAIGANDFLNNMMDAERLRCVVGAMRSRTYAPDSRIIQEGEQGDHFYIAEEGEFEVVKGGVIKSTFGAGVVFGELAILYKAKRFASIRAMGPGEARVWQLERQVFQKIMISTGCQEREQNILFLSSVPVLKDVAQDVLDKMVDLLKRVSEFKI